MPEVVPCFPFVHVFREMINGRYNNNYSFAWGEVNQTICIEPVRKLRRGRQIHTVRYRQWDLVINYVRQ